MASIGTDKKHVEANRLEKKKIQEQTESILTELARLGGSVVGEDDVVFEGKKFITPEIYKDHIEGIIEFWVKYRDEKEEPKRYIKEYPFKPWDGAAAIVRAFKKYFGVTVVQKNSFFETAGYKQIPVSPTDTMNVPFGKCVIPLFRGTMHIQGSRDENGYQTFVLVIDAPKKYEAQVNGLFAIIKKELDEASIYRGKAIDGAEMPNFLDLEGIDLERIIYSQFTLRQLDANLWTPIRYPAVCKERGLDPKRAVLLQGQFGVGKTLAAMWTAVLCEEAGRTFIMSNPKDNNVFEWLLTAALYQPACLFVEDIDKTTDTTSRDQMSRLLDEFDGFRAKGKDIIIVLTTNRAERIHKGMLRPGRMDAVIEITKLDRVGMVRLIMTMFNDHELAKDIDLDAIYDVMQEFTPAFMKEVCQKVKLYSIARVAEGESEIYTTEDFLAAADEMRVHFNLHTGANELKERPTLDKALRVVMTEVLDHVPIESPELQTMTIEPSMKRDGGPR